MLIGTAALTETGMPASHAGCFQRVATQTGCVISSRAVGKFATGLLLGSYATKGFHNKAKSCDWGPMAGFVLSDPQFTKRGSSIAAIGAQAADLCKAWTAGAGEIPIWITEERRLELEQSLGLGPPQMGSNINEKRYTCRGKHFILRRALDAPGSEGKQLWAVGYAPGETRITRKLHTSTTEGFTPVMAVVDPLCGREAFGTYRSATTGDYDLFAVFPPAAGENRQSRALDTRMVGGSDRFAQSQQAFARQEDPHMGNLTARLRQIGDRLNRAIRASGYRGGNCVHHSDEAGRPSVYSVEYPVIAFVPAGGGPYCLQNDGDFKQFIRDVLRFRFYVTFNPGWHRQLGIQVSPQGNYEA
jgi:hypothetical protein